MKKIVHHLIKHGIFSISAGWLDLLHQQSNIIYHCIPQGRIILRKSCWYFVGHIFWRCQLSSCCAISSFFVIQYVVSLLMLLWLFLLLWLLLLLLSLLLLLLLLFAPCCCCCCFFFFFFFLRFFHCFLAASGSSSGSRRMSGIGECRAVWWAVRCRRVKKPGGCDSRKHPPKLRWVFP